MRVNKPLRIAEKPFKSMKTNTSKKRNFYTQGQRFTARVLFILWLLASSSPEGALAVPKHQMTPVTMTSPGEPSLASAPPALPPGGALQLAPDSPGVFWGDSTGSSPAIDAALQQRMSQESAPFGECELLRTSPKVTPVEENLSFQARGGESVRFSYQMGQWRAEVSSHIGAFSRRAVLPVMCSQGEDVASSLEVLSKYPSWYSQRQIHVLGENVCPTLGEVVYVGALGLRGGGEGEASGSGEPQGEDPAEQGEGEQTEQAVSSQAASPADHPTTTTATPIRASSSANQIEAKKLKEQIDQLYPKLSEATDEADAKKLVEELVRHLEHLLDLRDQALAKDSDSAQGYIVRLRQVHHARWGKTAYGEEVGNKLTALLERVYAQALQAANSDVLLTKTPAGVIRLAKTLEQLAMLDQERGAKASDLSLYTDAAILYQHILSICAKEKDTLDSQEAAALQNAAYHGLAQLQASMLAQAKGVDATPPEEVATLQERIAEDRSELEAFRADVKPRTTALINNLEDVLSDQGSSAEAIKQAEEAYIQGSQALFGEIKQRISEFLAKLYQESEALLGPAPCKYAVMGLGSMALQQITPYSDLEFAILMEDVENEPTAEVWREYFRKLTHLVHFRVINLGETALPYSQYKKYKNEVSLDHLGKRGLNFDLGGKTPLGRKDKSHLKKPYELIQPVSGMVYYLHNEEDKMEHMDKLLPYILESTCYVHGDSSLHERYVTEKRAFLLKSRDASGKASVSKARAKEAGRGGCGNGLQESSTSQAWPPPGGRFRRL